MSDGRIHLRSFAVGDSIRAFQAEADEENKAIIAYDYDRNKFDILQPSNVKFHYLMRDKKCASINSYYTPGFSRSFARFIWKKWQC